MLKSLGLWYGLFGYNIDQGLARTTALNLDSEHKILVQAFRMQFDPMFSRCSAAFRNGLIQAPVGFSNVLEWLALQSEKDELIKKPLAFEAFGI